MAEKNNIKTQYNKLLSIFDTNDQRFEPEQYDSSGNGQKQMITASTPEELEEKVLAFQQDFHVNQQSLKIAVDNEQKNIQSQTLKLPAYFDYELMEDYPLCAQALTVLAEECTTIGDNGKMLTVYSDNQSLKQELEILFYEILDINTTLYYWIRNTCKYGDYYLFLETQTDRGVTGVRELPVMEMERKEAVVNDRISTKFLWPYKGEEYTLWQVAHFRLLGNNRWLPYGSSVLAPVRTYWRMLRMVEDAMLVYRASRASERRVIKVNVGNSDPKDIPMLVQQAASRFKKSTLVDPRTGNINYKFNPATVEQDIFIAVRSDTASSPIETLPGAQNLNDIGDYLTLRDNFFTGIGIPKIFLGFSSDAASEGGGKNLSQLDVRFARKINRIQQCALQELNKIAMIHLVLRGYDEDDIRKFTLSLTNPSTQSDMLKIEHWLQKIDLYVKLTTPGENGIKPMSETRAKQLVLNMSNDDIIDDLRQQMVENVVGEEIKSASIGIKKSRIFDDLYKYYQAGIIGKDIPTDGSTPEAPVAEPGATEQPAAPDLNAEVPATETPEQPAAGAEPASPTSLQEKFISQNMNFIDKSREIIRDFKPKGDIL